MRKLLMLGLMVVATFLMSAQLNAQKYGHMNSGNLLQEMAAVKTANKNLEAYQKQMIARGEEMATAFQGKLQAYMKEADAGELSKVQMQQKETVLQQERDNIMKYEQEVMDKVQVKRQELIEPILKKVDEAIQAVGKENGYKMIFDTSLANAILFVKDTDDVTALVKAKLGM